MALTVGTDTYLTLADANTYFASRLAAAAWDNASDADKEKALKQACRHIEALDPAGWHGDIVDIEQALAWPRYNVPQRKAGGVVDLTYGVYYDSTEYPPPLTDAQCEEALELLKEAAHAPTLAAERHRAMGVTEIDTGKGRGVKYGAAPRRYGGSLHSAQAWHLLQPLRRVSAEAVRGLG